MRQIDTVAEVRPSVDLAKLAHQWDSACGREERAEKSLGEIRLEKGRILVEARKAFPARGPKAKGWGELLAKWRIAEQTARDYMRLAGYVEEISTKFVETDGPSPIPTYAEAGIVKPPRDPNIVDAKVTLPDGRESTVEVDISEFNEAEGQRISEEERQASYQREVEASLPPRIEVREKRTHEVVEIVATARATIARLAERGVHLTDVTTSPDDFMRAKQMLIDITNRCLEELSNAGVLDGKEQRRQMTLLDGGKK